MPSCLRVLGLLIWTAYGVYSGQNVAIQTLAAKDLQLDLALMDYGSEAVAGRALLRQGIARTVDDIWGERQHAETFVARNFAAALDSLRRRQAYLDSLDPQTDRQKRALAAATQTIDAIAQSRLQMSFALSSPVSYPLILTVLGWAAVYSVALALCRAPMRCPSPRSRSAQSRSRAPLI